MENNAKLSYKWFRFLEVLSSTQIKFEFNNYINRSFPINFFKTTLPRKKENSSYRLKNVKASQKVQTSHIHVFYWAVAPLPLDTTLMMTSLLYDLAASRRPLALCDSSSISSLTMSTLTLIILWCSKGSSIRAAFFGWVECGVRFHLICSTLLQYKHLYCKLDEVWRLITPLLVCVI